MNHEINRPLGIDTGLIPPTGPQLGLCVVLVLCFFVATLYLCISVVIFASFHGRFKPPFGHSELLCGRFVSLCSHFASL